MSRFYLTSTRTTGWSNSRLEAVHYANENEDLSEELSVRTCCDGKDREHEAGSKQERKSSRLGTQMKMDLVIVDPDVSELNKCFIASFNDTAPRTFTISIV
ncbi:hypothetical protein DPMN_123734 [Dreissena polymorpha]|uniref:Uncharacterized protein n=1 Tax=Dreissena polymorpha TaxID=45954 RepID=A0A9D4GV11_DREPO|nr:hypothetical protein DPMN_123734 [Dreissena polymorpha]